ncbi:acyl-CoA dehydrogenase family protein [Nocardioides sp. SYSU DS0663]|uniref:acyl-CoA dehydrogenase family protein n=1 Tax=Nocardioides sp. SYSU DS0663 TaxID=3416445 RepID=UPI003F4B63EF
MEVALSEEQQQLSDTVRSLLEKRGDARVERYDEQLWRTLCDQIGVAALAVPEELGGAGFSLVESFVVLEEVGRALVPSPLLASLVTAEALLAGADEEGRERLLPRLAAGEVGAFVDATGAGTEGGASVERVLEGDHATVLVAATDDGLWELDPDATDRQWTPSMDQTLRLATVTVDTSRATRLAAAATAAVDRARLVGTAGTAALQTGCAARALDMTVGYSKERVQFGRPIGSFQALKHRMADMLVLVEMCRSASWAAAHAVSAGGPGAWRPVHVAKAYCSEALLAVAAETVQLHGGIAITWEHDAHLVLKRAQALGQLLGSAREHRASISL